MLQIKRNMHLDIIELHSLHANFVRAEGIVADAFGVVDSFDGLDLRPLDIRVARAGQPST